jgi:hypothetical protein
VLLATFELPVAEAQLEVTVREQLLTPADGTALQPQPPTLRYMCVRTFANAASLPAAAEVLADDDDRAAPSSVDEPLQVWADLLSVHDQWHAPRLINCFRVTQTNPEDSAIVARSSAAVRCAHTCMYARAAGCDLHPGGIADWTLPELSARSVMPTQARALVDALHAASTAADELAIITAVRAVADMCYETDADAPRR